MDIICDGVVLENDYKKDSIGFILKNVYDRELLELIRGISECKLTHDQTVALYNKLSAEVGFWTAIFGVNYE